MLAKIEGRRRRGRQRMMNKRDHILTTAGLGTQERDLNQPLLRAGEGRVGGFRTPGPTEPFGQPGNSHFSGRFRPAGHLGPLWF